MVRLLVRFNVRLDHETITKGTLLSSLVETNGSDYLNQVKLGEHPAELYGADFRIGAPRKDNQHWFSIPMNVINGYYLQNSQVLAEAAGFLKETIFASGIQAGQFEAETSQQEKENLETYLGSIVKGKQTYTSLALQSVYLDQPEGQRTPSFRAVAALAREATASLAYPLRTSPSPRDS